MAVGALGGKHDMVMAIGGVSENSDVLLRRHALEEIDRNIDAYCCSPNSVRIVEVLAAVRRY